jgi:heat shock protein HspQ
MTDDKKPPTKRRTVAVKVKVVAAKGATKAPASAAKAAALDVARKLAEKAPPRRPAEPRAAKDEPGAEARPGGPTSEARLRSAAGARAKPAQRRPRVQAAVPGRQRTAKFGIGHVVKHRVYGFRGVVFDIDPVFANTDEWWQSIPEEIRPRKDQPFYHLLAENAETEYIAYVSEQNLLPDTSGMPLRHPQVKQLFRAGRDGVLKPVFVERH